MTLAVLDWPTTEALKAFSVDWALSDPALMNRSLFSGAAQTAHDPFPRWMVTVTFNNRRNIGQRERFAFLSYLSGRSKRLRLWHQENQGRPLGTMRGVPTLAAPAVQFAESIQINGTTGETLLPGDMLGIGSMLVTVVDGGTFSGGLLTTTVAPRLREQVNAAAAVVWDRPTTRFLMTTDMAKIPFDPKVSRGFSVQFEENWS